MYSGPLSSPENVKRVYHTSTHFQTHIYTSICICVHMHSQGHAIVLQIAFIVYIGLCKCTNFLWIFLSLSLSLLVGLAIFWGWFKKIRWKFHTKKLLRIKPAQKKETLSYVKKHLKMASVLRKWKINYQMSQLFTIFFLLLLWKWRVRHFGFGQ